MWKLWPPPKDRPFLAAGKWNDGCPVEADRGKWTVWKASWTTIYSDGDPDKYAFIADGLWDLEGSPVDWLMWMEVPEPSDELLEILRCE